MEKKVEALREKIARFVSYCEEVMKMPEPNLSKGYLEGKKLMVANMWNKIETANDEIAEVADDKTEAKTDYLKKDYDMAFTMLDKVTIRIQTKLEKFKPVVTPFKSQGDTVVNDKPNIKLKAMDIPILSGEYELWLSFRNMFESLVHNKKYDDLDKMHYLKSCVDGDAERVISQYDISAEAYGAAYTALVDRFHNEAILIDTHIIKILSQPNLHTESGNGLKEMMDVTTVNLQALKSLKVKIEYWDPILLLLLVQKLDMASRRLWEQTLKPKTLPTMAEFLDFLKFRFHALGCQQKFNFSIEPSTDKSRSKDGSFGKSSNFRYETPKFPPRVHQSFHTSTGRRGKCPFRCNTSHEAIECERFLKMDTRTRMDLVTNARLCKNCLKPHGGKCSLQPGCRSCRNYHHELLHPHNEPASRDTTSNRNKSNSAPSSKNPFNSNTLIRSDSGQNIAISRSAHHTYIEPKTSEVNRNDTSPIAWDEPVLLSTAIVLVRSQRDDRLYPFRALLDDASETSYASEYLVQTLGLRKKDVLANATGLGGVKTGQIKHVVSFEISSRHNPTFNMMVEGPVTKKITQPLPSTFIARRNWNHIKELPLADPQFYIPSKIDLLLGSSVYGYLMLPGLVKSSPQEPVARNTEFGWIISGPVRKPNETRRFSSLHLRIDVDDQLKRFFEQEEVSKERILTKEENECEQFYMKTYRRNEDGRFVVALPFKGDPKTLGSSKGQAISRLTNLEQRFSKNNALKVEYTNILKEYEQLGHTTDIGPLSDKSTDAFLAAFDRFTARKGFPECCYSDNALTFIGAKTLLAPEPENSLLDLNKVNEYTTKSGTDWKFITPRAPHQGGIWEAGVKAMKHHLKRVIGANVLTFEEMSTITAKIEACLNSRPLCQLNDDPDDLEVLTPGHFLIGRPLMAKPERVNATNKNITKRNRWRLIEAIQRDFWKSWSNEYLNELQIRQKWRVTTRNFKEGDIVLVKEDNIPPLKWPLARIVKVHPSTDGNVRSATVKMAGEGGKITELKRPIVKMQLLPTEEDEDGDVQTND